MPITSTQTVLREAKRLHRAAGSDSLSSALPVLRRLIAAGAWPSKSLTGLFRVRGEVQRKHILRMLALEAGEASWEEYRPKLDHLDAQQLDPFEVLHVGYANLNLWFSSEAEARTFAGANGGRVVSVGEQAVVLPAPGSHSCAEQGA